MKETVKTKTTRNIGVIRSIRNGVTWNDNTKEISIILKITTMGNVQMMHCYLGIIYHFLDSCLNHEFMS